MFALHRTRFPWVAAHVSDAPSVFEARVRGGENEYFRRVQ